MAPLRLASWQVLARRERAAADRGAYAMCALPGGLRVPRVFLRSRAPARPGFSIAASAPGIEIAASPRFELDDIRAAILRAVDHDSVSAAALSPCTYFPRLHPAVARKSHSNNLQASELSEPQFDLAND